SLLVSLLSVMPTLANKLILYSVSFINNSPFVLGNKGHM
ncbi:unnamed protein product, partial [marine sediment metagenome]